MLERAIKKINENKLIRILNLLDSPMEGKVLAAAKSAARYLKSHGASWNEVVHERIPVNGKRQVLGTEEHLIDFVVSQGFLLSL